MGFYTQDFEKYEPFEATYAQGISHKAREANVN